MIPEETCLRKVDTRRFAGHTPPHITGRYLQPTLTEVATTIATLTGEPHPLAPPTNRTCHHR